MSIGSPILVSSHRRSGTHLTIDLLLNNLVGLAKTGYISLDRVLSKAPGRPLRRDEVRVLHEAAPVVVKTHASGDYRRFFSEGLRQPPEIVERVFSRALRIYVWRRAPAVHESLLLYWKQLGAIGPHVGLSEFLRMPSPAFTGDRVATQSLTTAEYWAQHVLSGIAWAQVVVPYDELQNDPRGVLGRIAAAGDFDLHPTFSDPRVHVDGRLGPLERLRLKLGHGRHTGVQVGLGANDRPHASPEDIEYLRSLLPRGARHLVAQAVD